MRGHKRFKDGAWRLVVEATKDPVTGKRRHVNRTVRRMVERGVLPVVPHMGHRLVIPRNAVVRLVESAEIAAAQGQERPLSVAL